MSSSRALCCLPSEKKHKYDFNFFRSLYDKTIIKFGFCDIQNNRGLGKGYRPRVIDLGKSFFLISFASGRFPRHSHPSQAVYLFQFNVN